MAEPAAWQCGAGSEVERDGSDGCVEVAVDAAVVRLRPVGVDAARGHVNVLQHVGAVSHRHLEVSTFIKLIILRL